VIETFYLNVYIENENECAYTHSETRECISYMQKWRRVVIGMKPQQLQISLLQNTLLLLLYIIILHPYHTHTQLHIFSLRRSTRRTPSSSISPPKALSAAFIASATAPGRDSSIFITNFSPPCPVP